MNAIAKAKAAAPAPLLPEEIRARLSEAKARHGALTARQFELAERSILSSDAEKEYMQVIDQMAAVQGEIERYELAIQSLDAKGKQQLAAAEAAAISALRSRTTALLDRRLEPARVFEAAIVEAVRAMREIAALGKAAWEAWPGQQPDHGVVFGGSELSVLIAGELARLGTVPVSTGGAISPSELSLPAPRAPSILTAGAPDMIEPLTAAIANANAWAKSHLGG